MSAETQLASLKHAIRDHGFAWPGGYPMYAVMADGDVLSIQACKDNWADICRSTIGRHRDGWQFVACDINWENVALYCSHTGERIESAYAEDC